MIGGYENVIALPTMGVFDTSMMQADIAAARELYNQAREDYKDFRKEYSSFYSPIANDNTSVYNMTVGELNKLIDKHGADLIRSGQGRSDLRKLINGVNTAAYGQMKQNAKNYETYLQAVQQAKQNGTYSPELEARELNALGLDPNNFSTVDSSGGIHQWDRLGPSKYQDLNQLTSHYFDDLKPTDLGAVEGTRFSRWYGISDNEINQIIPSVVKDLGRTENGKMFIDRAMDKTALQLGYDQNSNLSDEQKQIFSDTFYQNISKDIRDANAERLAKTIITNDEGKTTYSERQANYRAGLAHKQQSGNTTPLFQKRVSTSDDRQSDYGVVMNNVLSVANAIKNYKIKKIGKAFGDTDAYKQLMEGTYKVGSSPNKSFIYKDADGNYRYGNAYYSMIKLINRDETIPINKKREFATDIYRTGETQSSGVEETSYLREVLTGSDKWEKDSNNAYYMPTSFNGTKLTSERANEIVGIKKGRLSTQFQQYLSSLGAVGRAYQGDPIYTRSAPKQEGSSTLDINSIIYIDYKYIKQFANMVGKSTKDVIDELGLHNRITSNNKAENAALRAVVDIAKKAAQTSGESFAMPGYDDVDTNMIGIPVTRVIGNSGAFDISDFNTSYDRRLFTGTKAYEEAVNRENWSVRNYGQE